MRKFFTEEHKLQGLNKIELEDILLEGEWIEGSQKRYVICGSAVIDGEIYHEFLVEFETTEEPSGLEIEQIMAIDWDWYDYRFESI